MNARTCFFVLAGWLFGMSVAYAAGSLMPDDLAWLAAVVGVFLGATGALTGLLIGEK